MVDIPADGPAIKNCRTRLGYSQKELAGRVGCAPRTIIRAEQSNPAERSTLERIAFVLKVPMEHIIKGEPTVECSPRLEPFVMRV